jgi:predicted ATPase
MQYLKVENFKCFYGIDIPLNSLTLFAGTNGSGKSTAIQALLFLRRTIEHCAKWENNRYVFLEPNGLNVELNGAYCLALGNSGYVLPRNSNIEYIRIGLIIDNQTFVVEYHAEESKLWLKPVGVLNDMEMSGIFLQEFYYLNAERIGPRITQNIKFYDFPNTGYQGEYVAQLIADTQENYRFEIEERRRNSNSKSPRLEQQVNAWINEIMPGVSIYGVFNPDTHSAQIKVDNYFIKGDPTISTNIGFGISYVLPIIVTGLIAKSGSYMIVENPEAHLHPAAQSKIGRFLSVIADGGVNVIVETHSEHVINGVQIASVIGEIAPNKVTINFFSQSDETQPHLDSLSINSIGELSSWPRGFFDQSQSDLATLFNIRKK